MRKLRLSLLLPIVQVLIAAFFTRRADLNSWLRTGQDGHSIPSQWMLSLYPRIMLAWEVCRGVNAPAMTFKALTLLHPSRNQPPYFSLFGFMEEEVWFLFGVGTLWYVVGRMIDRHQSGLSPRRTRKTVVNLLLLGFGIFLLVEGGMGLRDAIHPGAVWFYPLYDGVFWILLFLWSVFLIVFSTIRLSRQNQRGAVL